MFKGVHHVTYVARDVAEVEEFMERVFGMKAVRYKEQPDVEEELGFKIAFYEVGPIIVDFFEPVREDTDVAKFLREKGPGVFHVGWEVEGINKVAEDLDAKGAKPGLGNRPRNSAHGYKTVSIYPTDNPIGIWFHLAEGPMTLNKSV